MTTQPFLLLGHRVLVTGASSGIGRATALVLSQLGARVVLSGRDEAELALTRQAMATPSNHSLEPMELKNSEAIPSWLEEVANRHGQLNGLVHCAGVQWYGPIRALAAQRVTEMLAINVTAPIMLTRGFRSKKVRTEVGAIVLISSVMGLAGAPMQSVYGASKGAVHAFVRSAAMELAKEGVRINAIAPGLVTTPMSNRMLENLTTEQSDAIKKAHPLGFGSPSDVASAAAFLVGPGGAWITGTTLVVDGGYTSH